jgi:hypothetical protein
MIEKSDKKKEFFDKNGKFLVKKPESWDIKQVIKEEKQIDIIDDDKLDQVINMIYSMLKINPNERTINN